MTENKKIPLLVIVGPTASGKTALAVELAKLLDGEIVSADSMQIYKSMPIAAAVPSADERQGIAHHLMEFLDAGDEFSVADYVNLARKTILDIHKRKKLPILVGGTGLYVNSIVDNIEYIEQPSDPLLREKLEREFEELGGEEMLRRLREFDLQTAERLHANNRRRIIRAFEVYLQSGKTMTEQNELSRKNPSPYDVTMIGITFEDRAKLYERINLRVDKMVELGLLEEAKNNYLLEKRGAGQAIGHKELAPYFRDEISLSDALENLKRETRRYAKRQLTWFCRDSRINWIYADREDALESAKKIIRSVKNEG